MVDVTIVFMGIIMVYKPTNITGGPYPACHPKEKKNLSPTSSFDFSSISAIYRVKQF
jgi:hypothetical protein